MGELLAALSNAARYARDVANITGLTETQRQHAGHIVALCDFEHERFNAIAATMRLDPLQTTLSFEAPSRGTVGCEPT